MRCYMARTVVLTTVAWLGFLTNSMHGQQLRAPNGANARMDRKGIAERHFESVEPRPKAALGGAIPGIQLLREHRQQADRVHARLRASRAMTSASVRPEGGVSEGSAMPGIMLRPYLAAGELPTSVATGDFNDDGHMDFAVANGSITMSGSISAREMEPSSCRVLCL
jgi:hypothetical protein